jgi:hypothetical protein
MNTPTYNVNAGAEGVWTLVATIIGAAVGGAAVSMGLVDEGSSAVIAGAVTGAVVMLGRWLIGVVLPTKPEATK